MRVKPPNQFRVRRPPLATTDAYGQNGYFKIPHPRIHGYYLNCIVSDQGGWEHVSVSVSSDARKVERCPTWEEMSFVRDTFWTPEETVMQLHPPHSQYVNVHDFCLHLWRPQGVEIPVPEKIMV